MSELHDVVLVDLDGTLTDSAPGIIESITYAYRTLGLPVPGEEALRSLWAHRYMCRRPGMVSARS